MKITHCLLAVASLVAASGAWAKDKEKNWTIDGGSLAISSPCAKSVTIEPSASLSGKVEISASADRQAEIDNLAVAGGSVASIGTNSRECKDSGWHLSLGFRSGIENGPTLHLDIRVPAGMEIDIKEGKSTDYQIGAVRGVLHLDLSGSGDVSAEEAKDLVAGVTGSGGARIERTSGSLQGRLSGSGDLSITHADIAKAELSVTGSGNVSVEESTFSEVSARLTGSGNLSLGEGNVGALTLVSTGSANADIEASVGTADLTVTGSSDVRVHQVTGQIKQSQRGSGSIEIGGR